MLQKQVVLYSSLSADEFLHNLTPSVALQDEFTLLSKLSDGGIVVRALAAPKTTLPFWGKIKPDGFKITQSLYDKGLSPFQPILYGKLIESEGGCELTLTLRPHPQASSFWGIHSFVGGLLAMVGLAVAPQKPGFGILSTIIGLLLIAFPTFRAKYSFQQGVERALQAFAALGLTAAEQTKFPEQLPQ